VLFHLQRLEFGCAERERHRKRDVMRGPLLVVPSAGDDARHAERGQRGDDQDGHTPAGDLRKLLHTQLQ
jgi:hypothetical protein